MAKKRTPVRRNRPGTTACGDPLHPPDIPDIEPDNVELLAETNSSFKELGIVRTGRKRPTKPAQTQAA